MACEELPGCKSISWNNWYRPTRQTTSMCILNSVNRSEVDLTTYWTTNHTYDYFEKNCTEGEHFKKNVT